MNRTIAITIISMVILSFSPLALADTYQYVDDEGVVHLTNKKDEVPEKYGDACRVEVDKRTDYYEPTMKEKVVSRPRTLFNNLTTVLKEGTSNIAVLLAVAAGSTALIVVSSYIFMRKGGYRLQVILLTLSCVYLVLIALYIEGVLKSGNDIKSEVEKARSRYEGLQNIIEPE